jgi:hypothetical protein
MGGPFSADIEHDQAALAPVGRAAVLAGIGRLSSSCTGQSALQVSGRDGIRTLQPAGGSGAAPSVFRALKSPMRCPALRCDRRADRSLNE